MFTPCSFKLIVLFPTHLNIFICFLLSKGSTDMSAWSVKAAEVQVDIGTHVMPPDTFTRSGHWTNG